MKRLTSTLFLRMSSLRNGCFLILCCCFLGSMPKASGQAGCCVAVNFNDFQSYCIRNMNPCQVGTTCTSAALDAAYGITGNWINHTCNTGSPDCSAQGCGALPVELFGFDIILVDRGIELTWSTAAELNNDGFMIEKSTDGKTWSTLHFVEGQGTSIEHHNYSWVDESPIFGFNYYRLKQVDIDGFFDYSPMRVTIWQGGDDYSKFELAVLPNPASEWITAALPSDMTLTENIEFTIYNQVGQLVHRFNRSKDEEIRISLDKLPRGYYVLEARQGRIHKTARFIKS